MTVSQRIGAEFKSLRENELSLKLDISSIEDTLTSTSSTTSLSASQGKVLKDLIDGIDGISSASSVIDTPIVTSLATSANEEDNVVVTIGNYDSLLTYIVNTSGGAFVRNGSAITWTLPKVTTDTNHVISVSATDGSDTSSIDSVVVSVLNIPAVADQSLLYEGNSVTSEFTTLKNTIIVSDKIVASGNRTLDVISNAVSSSIPIEVGDTAILDGDRYEVSTTSESPIVLDILGDSSCTTFVTLDTDATALGAGTVTTTAPVTFGHDGVLGGTSARVSDDASVIHVAQPSVHALSFWFNRSSVAGSNRYLYDDRKYGGSAYVQMNLVMTVAGCVCYVDGVQMVSNNTTPEDDSWHHMVVMPTKIPNGVSLGNYQASPSATFAFDGFIDHIRTFDRDLTLSEMIFLQTEITYTITGTNPIMPGAIVAAELLTKSAESLVINQDEADTDFAGISGIEVKQEFNNIVDASSSANTLISNVYIEEGDILKVSDGTNTGDLTCGAVTFVTPNWSVDTTSVTSGGTPTLAYKQDSKVQFDFSNGYEYLVGRSDAITSVISPVAEPILVTSTYTDFTDATGGRTLQARVKLNNEQEKVSKISGIIQKLA